MMNRFTETTHFTGLSLAWSGFSALALLLCANMSFAAEADSLQKEFFNVGSTFSNVVTTSHGGVTTIYVSGQVGIADGEIPEDFGQQVEYTFANLRRQLQAAGATPEDVVQIRTYIVDISSERVSAYNEARVGFFTQQNKPASTMVGVPGLVIPELLVEVEAIAVIENQPE
ncbi:MAG: RidA family protein [Gammaproteobacteria bacterium]|nr:RidA family protein [Gammaproteobacteria bacterium]